MGVLDSLRWTRRWLVELWKRWERWALCRRVLITSRGWTARVEIVPAERPPRASISNGENRAWLSVISWPGEGGGD